MRWAKLVGMVLTTVSLSLTAHAAIITLESMLDEMVDRDRFASLPDPAYVCKFYLDGSAEPVIAGNVADVLGGEMLTGKPLSAERSRGR